MLALFKSKPLLEQQEQQWLIDTFIWAVENFDAEFFTKHTQIILPTATFSLIRYRALKKWRAMFLTALLITRV